MFRTNLTCGMDGCIRHSQNDDSESFDRFKLNEDNLRTVMRNFRRTRFNEGQATVNIIYFKGRKGAVSDVCRVSEVGSVRDKIILCSKCTHAAAAILPLINQCIQRLIRIVTAFKQQPPCRCRNIIRLGGHGLMYSYRKCKCLEVGMCLKGKTKFDLG